MLTHPLAYGLIIPQPAMDALTEPMPGWPSLLASITEPVKQPTTQQANPYASMNALLANLSIDRATNE